LGGQIAIRRNAPDVGKGRIGTGSSRIDDRLIETHGDANLVGVLAVRPHGKESRLAAGEGQKCSGLGSLHLA
jgi:hypothetical protein